MKSKSKIAKQIERKTNPVLVETILAAKKHPAWLKVASILSGPRKGFVNMNLSEINEKIKDAKEDTFVVPGKVLGQGKLDKKINLVALGFSGKAREKIKGKSMDLIEGIKQNPEGKNIKILTK